MFMTSMMLRDGQLVDRSISTNGKAATSCAPLSA